MRLVAYMSLLSNLCISTLFGWNNYASHYLEGKGKTLREKSRGKIEKSFTFKKNGVFVENKWMLMIDIFLILKVL